jgi:hypothetical protein
LIRLADLVEKKELKKELVKVLLKVGKDKMEK